MGRVYKRLRRAGQDVPELSEYLAMALHDGIELLRGTSGLWDGGDECGLDDERARSAWGVHRESVLEWAAREHPGEKTWATRFDAKPLLEA